MLKRVCYDEKYVTEVLKKDIVIILEKVHDVEEIQYYLNAVLSMYHLIVKDPSFEYEQETRIIYLKPKDENRFPWARQFICNEYYTADSEGNLKPNTYDEQNTDYV